MPERERNEQSPRVNEWMISVQDDISSINSKITCVMIMFFLLVIAILLIFVLFLNGNAC